MLEAIHKCVVAFGQWLYDRSGGWVFEQPVPQTLHKYCRGERVHVLRDSQASPVLPRARRCGSEKIFAYP